MNIQSCNHPIASDEQYVSIVVVTIVAAMLAAGEIKVSKCRKVPGTTRTKQQKTFFWRFAFNRQSMHVLTDRPASEFVLGQ